MPESAIVARGQEHQDLSLVTNTLRLCLALKQSPTLRRQLQTYALDSVRSAAAREGGAAPSWSTCTSWLAMWRMSCTCATHSCSRSSRPTWKAA